MEKVRVYNLKTDTVEEIPMNIYNMFKCSMYVLYCI
jgi:hypothetical protein